MVTELTLVLKGVLGGVSMVIIGKGVAVPLGVFSNLAIAELD